MRRLAVLIRGLPPDGAFARATRGDEVGWGYAEELLAGTVERLDLLTWLFRAAWFKGRPDAPRPVWRPGQPAVAAPAEEAVQERPRKSTPEEIRAFFFGAGAKVIYTPD